MFDLVAKYKRVIQVFLGLIALTFATWGIESYTRFRGAGDAVASVNGMKISQREFTDELRRQQDQVRKMFGRAIDPAALDTPESRRRLLDSRVPGRRPVLQGELRAGAALAEPADVASAVRVAAALRPVAAAARARGRRLGDRAARRRPAPVGPRVAEARGGRCAHADAAVPFRGQDRRGEAEGPLRREPGGFPHPGARARRVRRALGGAACPAGAGHRGGAQERL